MKKIAVVGVGQLGSRHLQALAKLDFEAKIYVVDPFEKSLSIAKSRFKEIESENKHLLHPFFLTKIDELDQELDIVIIATNSDIRLRVLESLMANRNVSYLILEKVLFQKLSEYDAASELLEKSGTKTWVNCSRRMWAIYESFQKTLKNARVLSFNVYGVDWGLASNAIHMLDLFSYLSGIEVYTINMVNIFGGLNDSKRKGFKEFNGNISGTFGESLPFSISSFEKGNVPLTVEIITENEKHLISEELQKYFYSSIANNWETVETKFSIPFQSELSNIFVNDILDKGGSKLPTYEIAKKLHLPLIKSLLESLNKIEKQEVTICPIT